MNDSLYFSVKSFDPFTVRVNTIESSILSYNGSDYEIIFLQNSSDLLGVIEFREQKPINSATIGKGFSNALREQDSSEENATNENDSSAQMNDTNGPSYNETAAKTDELTPQSRMAVIIIIISVIVIASLITTFIILRKRRRY